MPHEIRPEVPAERARIHEVEEAAFGRRSEADLGDALRKTARPHVSLVALVGDSIVGHVFLSPAEIESDGDAPPVAAVGPVAVHPDHQGQGVGSALVRAGLDRCPDNGWRAAFLVGNPAYYARFGFELALPLGFRYGNPAFDPVFQVFDPGRRNLAGFEGRVRFDPAFDRAES